MDNMIVPKIRFEHFNYRAHGLNYKPPGRMGVSYQGLAVIDEAKNLFLEHNAITKIKNWRSLHFDTNIAFLEAVDALLVMIENSESQSKVKTMCQFLESEISKVKDVDQLKRSLKRKFSVIKNMSDTDDKIRKKLRTPKYALIHPGQKNIAAIPQPGVAKLKTQLPPNPTPAIGLAKCGYGESASLLKECYDILYMEACRMYECDRIVKNYKAFSEKFNIDNIFNEYVAGKRDIYDAGYSVSACLSSYRAPFKNIYNSILETCWYTLSKKHIKDYSIQSLIEGITDYFLFNNEMGQTELQEAQFVLEYSPILEDTNHHIHLSYLTNARRIYRSNKTKHPDDIKHPQRSHRVKQVVSEDVLAEALANSVTGERSDATKVDDIVRTPVNDLTEEKKRVELHELIDNFKKKSLHGGEEAASSDDIIILKSFIDQIVKTCPEQIPDEFARILSICRMRYIIYYMIHIVDILDEHIESLCKAMKKVPIDEKQTEKVIKALETEIRFMESRIDRLQGTRKDEQREVRYNAYLIKLKKHLKDMQEYYEICKETNKPEEDLPEDPEDIIKESAKISLALDLFKQLHEAVPTGKVADIVSDKITTLPSKTIEAIVNYMDVTGIFDHSTISRALKEDLKKQRELVQLDESATASIQKIDLINESIRKLSKLKKTPKLTLESVIQSMIGAIGLVNESVPAWLAIPNYPFTQQLKDLTDDIAGKTATIEHESPYIQLLDNKINEILKWIKANPGDLGYTILKNLESGIKDVLDCIGNLWMVKAFLTIIKSVCHIYSKVLTDEDRQFGALRSIEYCISECDLYLEKMQREPASSPYDIAYTNRIVLKIKSALEYTYQSILYAYNKTYKRRFENVY